MNVDTLLTRQMELHTSVRHPPKNPEQLTQLHETMRNYHHYFGKLKSLGEQLQSDPETVFQCFMYISMGGAVSFDKQHQDGSVPMHQAKVLARTSAIQLEPGVRAAIPIKELMVYVGLSKDLRTSLRVKVEDGNDLLTAEKSVSQALEYLDFIYAKSRGDADRMFAFYMVEDSATLERMLETPTGSPTTNGAFEAASADGYLCRRPTTASSLGASLTIGGAANGAHAWSLPGAVGTEDGAGAGQNPLLADDASLAPLPSPLSSLPEALQEQANVASNSKANASHRLRAAQTLLDWLTSVPTDFFVEQVEPILQAVGEALAVLTAEKRSALCRIGCNAIALLMQRLCDEPYLVQRGDSPVLTSLLTTWTQTLCKGVYVTVAAISSATDFTLRELVLCSHGHLAVVKAVLAALQSGTQTELRRKCLGYLALAVAAASRSRTVADGTAEEIGAPIDGSVPSFVTSLIEPAQKYVQVGDSPSRKMARALCAVLRAVGHVTVAISDPKTEKLIQLEKAHILPFLDDPRELERVLFETNNFVSSMRPGTASSSTSAGSRPASSNVKGMDGNGVRSFGGSHSATARDPSSRNIMSAVGGGQRTVLSAASGVNAENPMLSYPSKRVRQGRPPTSPAAAVSVPVSFPEEHSHPQAQKKPTARRPVQLPPLSPSAEAGSADAVFDTSASLGLADDNGAAMLEGEEERDEGELPSTSASSPSSQVVHPQQPQQSQRAHPLNPLRAPGASNAGGSERLLPLSLRPAGSSKSASPQRHGHSSASTSPRGAAGGLGDIRPPMRSPVKARKSRSNSRRSNPTTLVGDGSPSNPALGQPSTNGAPPRLSDSLRRKIEANHR